MATSVPQARRQVAGRALYWPSTQAVAAPSRRAAAKTGNASLSNEPADPPTRDARFALRLSGLEPVLRRYLARRIAPALDDLADLVQEVHLRMLRYRDVEAPDELKWIMLRIAGSVVVDRHRRARSRGVELDLARPGPALVASEEPEPDRVAQGSVQWQRVRSAIASLPPQCRRVFLLHRFQGMSYREIADRFGVSVRTVENQVALALARCRAAVAREDE